MTAPLVTVLMPAYNAAPYIEESIRSVLAQTFTNFELVIIDDGSTDRTRDAIAQFSDTRIRVFTHSQNLGIIKTLNSGIEQARGGYIARLDADDIAYPARLKNQVDILEQEPDVGLVAAWTEIIDEDDRTTGFGNWRLSPEAIYYVLHFRQCLTHSSVMFRTSLARELGGYSERALHAEDFDLWHRMAKVSRIVQLEAVLVKWRQRRAGITGTALDQMQQTAFRLAHEHIQQITGETIPTQIVEALIDCRKTMQLDATLLAAFSAQFKKVQNAIAQAAPRIYDQKRLRSYVEIEAVKYAYILRSLGQPFDLTTAFRAKLLGFAYYLACYHRLPLLGTVVPKSHF